VGIQIWDVHTREGELLPASDGFSHLTFSPDGESLAAFTPQGAVRVWSLATREVRASAVLKEMATPTDLAFSPDHRHLAVSTSSGRVVVWKINGRSLYDRAVVSLPHREQPEEIVFGSSAVLVSRNINGTVWLWNVDSGRSIGQLGPKANQVASVAADAKGAVATADKDGLIRFWALGSRQQVGAAQPSGSRRRAALMFAESGVLVSIGSDVRIWDTSRWAHGGEQLYFHRSAVTALAVSPEGSTVASGDTSGNIRLWDAATGLPWPAAPPAHRGPVTALAISADGHLASGGRDGAVHLWDTSSRAELTGPTQTHDGTVTSLAFSTDGGTLAGGFAKGAQPTWHRRSPIHVWDVATGETIQRLTIGARGGAASVAFSSRGLFASAGADYLAWWSVGDWLSNRLIEDPGLGPYTAVAFSPDGTLLASSATRFARRDHAPLALWSMPSGDQVGQRLDAGETDAQDKSFAALSFSPDGTLLAGVGAGGVQLWDIARHQRIGGRLRSSAGDSLAVSPDGQLIMVGDRSGAVRAYPATVDGWMKSVCEVVSRNLTRSEWEFFVGPALAYTATCAQYPIDR
jgi:WD40 repeat protein